MSSQFKLLMYIAAPVVSSTWAESRDRRCVARDPGPGMSDVEGSIEAA